MTSRTSQLDPSDPDFAAKFKEAFRGNMEGGRKMLAKLSQAYGSSLFTDFQSLQDWTQVYEDIGKHGTDVKMNAADPMGDGDQSSFSHANEKNAQFHRNLWCAGGDLIHQGKKRSLPDFIMKCIAGDYDGVVGIFLFLEKDKRKELLETRYCVLRQTPLMFVIVGYLNAIAARLIVPNPEHLKLVDFLLEMGARTDARDLCGKTALHYCMSRLCQQGDDTLVRMGAAIIAKSKEQNVNPPLVNIPDRYGDVALNDTIVANRIDLVKFLLDNKANPTILDNDGASAVILARNPGPVRDLVISCKNKEEYREHKSHCVKCLKSGVETSKCGKCKIATYCSRECQVAHWKVHKKECQAHEASAEIVIAPSRQKDVLFDVTKGENCHNFIGKPPKGMAVDTYFDVKVQVSISMDAIGRFNEPNPAMPLLVYNQARDVHVNANDENCPQRAELYKLVRGFPDAGGLKAFFRAKVTAQGNLVIATSPIFLKKW